MKKYYLGVIFLLFFIVFLSPQFAAAQSSAGVSIEPATIEEPADPGQTLSATLSLTNTTFAEQTFYLFTRDIVGVRDGNAPEFASGSQELTGFELSTWVVLPTDPYVLGPGESVRVPITIDVPENATPGSHFGGIFASVEAPRLREIGAGVGYEVASIITINISGDQVVNAQVREFSTDQLVHGSTNVDFTVRIQNTGTMLVRPYGPIKIYNMFGSEVKTLTVNDTAGGVFPGSVRDFHVSWRDENPGFGRYRAELAMTYEADAGQRSIDDTLTFWILPLNIILPALGVLAVILVVTYFGVKMYIRRALHEVTGGQRPLARRRRKKQRMSALLLVSVVLLAVTVLFLIVLLLLFA